MPSGYGAPAGVPAGGFGGRGVPAGGFGGASAPERSARTLGPSLWVGGEEFNLAHSTSFLLKLFSSSFFNGASETCPWHDGAEQQALLLVWTHTHHSETIACHCSLTVGR